MAIAAALAAAAPAYPQSAQPAGSSVPEEYSIFEINPFAGYQCVISPVS
jgi:hypothetical protein